MKKRWLFIGAAAIALAAVLLVSNQGWKNSTQNNNTNTVNTTVNQVAATAITVIDDGSKTQTYDYQPVQDETALALLQRIAKDKGIALDVKHYSSGDLVNGIGGVLGDDKTQTYWSFYINDKFAEVGAGSYKVKAGDRLGWKYQKL